MLQKYKYQSKINIYVLILDLLDTQMLKDSCYIYIYIYIYIYMYQGRSQGLKQSFQSVTSILLMTS